MSATKPNTTHRIVVGQLDEFSEGAVRTCVVGRWEIGIVKWQGTMYAVRNICPHQGAPICLGQLGPKIAAPAGTVGELEIDEAVPVLACGWHGWEFDVRDGTPLWGERGGEARRRTFRLRTLPVVIDGGTVSVELPASTNASEHKQGDPEKATVVN